MLCTKLIAGTMPTTRISSTSSSYATARTGGTLATSSTARLGQYLSGSNYVCYESFVEFDTSSLPDDATVVAAFVGINDYATYHPPEYDAEARAYDWGGGAVTTADWVSGANLAALPLVASRNTADFAGDATRLDSQSGAADGINLTGYSRFVLCSSTV